MSAVVGMGLGAVAAGGLLLAATGVPRARRPRLDDRLGPYLRDAPRPSRLLTSPQGLTPFPTLERILRPVLGDAMRFIEKWVGGVASVRRRLEQLGGDMTVEQFRAEQVIWGGFGLAAALVLTVLQLLGDGTSALTALGAAVALTVGGVLGRDRWLTRQVKQREQRMLEEFPTVAELLALAVTAGEGPVGALERVNRISSGELSRELGRALAEARAGASLVQALDGIARRTSLAPLARFVDGVAIAVEIVTVSTRPQDDAPRSVRLRLVRESLRHTPTRGSSSRHCGGSSRPGSKLDRTRPQAARAGGPTPTRRPDLRSRRGPATLPPERSAAASHVSRRYHLSAAVYLRQLWATGVHQINKPQVTRRGAGNRVGHERAVGVYAGERVRETRKPPPSACGGGRGLVVATRLRGSVGAEGAVEDGAQGVVNSGV
jgi:tight adherence protein C